MTWHDYRMDISTLCNSAIEKDSEEFVSGSDSSVTPFSPVHYVNENVSTKQHHLPASTNANGKLVTKRCPHRLSNSERGKLYRSRRKDYVRTLEDQVDQLKREVDQLLLYERAQQQSQRRLAVAYPLKWQSIGTSVAAVVNEYFALFKYGVLGSNNRNVPQDYALLSARQVAFLEGVMHPKLVFASSYGVHELLSQWEKYSLYHAGFQCEVKTVHIMTQDPNIVVVAQTTLNVRITRQTIEQIFPHLLWNEQLVQRLIGKEIKYSVRNTLYFDDDYKIHRYDSYVDFATAFVHLLGNSDDIMVLMESALVRQECMIGDLLEEPPRMQMEEIPKINLPPLRKDLLDLCNSSSNCLLEPSRPDNTSIGYSIQSNR
ncbi:uncharacterized protein PHALS_05488 [Plasmopara halstedii]|uniref:BZIP domain-containing protein n=1 Tax=Plasmopara halstedii TaxID=4781 RepID=A0A0P1B1Z9_PLAHL|nr:uncharacterized protein PHALS_05488 [Plasmopara halstedii]CEG48006.1 hypothetical protein PHALS_05488 [Plasmopara halstedii]|eukprot:XP_024584375.1 hypothetical protein PHALS_05488 [Plasmopara halstedii]